MDWFFENLDKIGMILGAFKLHQYGKDIEDGKVAL